MAMMVGALLWFFSEFLFISLGFLDKQTNQRPVMIEMGSSLLLIIPQLCYLVGLSALSEAKVIHSKIPIRLAQVAVLLYMAPFVSASAMKTGVSGSGKNPLLMLLPIGLVFIAISMTIVGVAVRKAKIWIDWRQYTPFAVGLFPVLLMLPLAAIYGKPNYILVAIWGLLWFLLGLAIYKTGQAAIQKRTEFL